MLDEWKRCSMQQDETVNRVIEKIRLRSERGMVHYGRPISATPGDIEKWLNEIQEELSDACVYIERLIEEVRKI